MCLGLEFYKYEKQWSSKEKHWKLIKVFFLSLIKMIIQSKPSWKRRICWCIKDVNSLANCTLKTGII